MARKTFLNGYPLPASDLNTYLMDQTVQTYADATARTAALPTPTEGQMSYLADQNTAYVYDGSSWNAVVDAKNYGATLPNGAAGRNKIMNGDFGVNQRTFSSTTTNSAFGHDRWKLGYSGGTVTYSTQTFTPGAAPVSGYESANYARLVSASQSAVGDFASWQQPIEDVRTFAGQTVTLSFWAKASTGTPKLATCLEQIFGSGGSSAVQTPAGQVTISSSWARYSVTVTVPSIAGKTIGSSSYVGLYIFTSAGSNFTAYTGTTLGVQNVTVDIWGVQLEAGSVATPFSRAAGTLQGELAACQLYYYQHIKGSGQAIGSGWNYTTTDMRTYVKFPVTMRTAPTLVVASGTNYYTFERAGAGDDFNSFSALRSTTNGITLNNSSEISGVAGQTGELFSSNSSSSIAFSSEL